MDPFNALSLINAAFVTRSCKGPFTSLVVDAYLYRWAIEDGLLHPNKAEVDTTSHPLSAPCVLAPDNVLLKILIGGNFIFHTFSHITDTQNVTRINREFIYKDGRL